MYEDKVILCVSNAYEKKYYMNEQFSSLPDEIKDRLKIICVLFTEEVGGILRLEYAEDGTLMFATESDESDLLYDDIACGLKIKQIQKKDEELLTSLELFYKVFFLGENYEWFRMIADDFGQKSIYNLEYKCK